MKDKNTCILLADDHDLVLQGLKCIVECSLPEIKHICTASTGQEVLRLVDSRHFDLFLLDIELPDMSGLDVIAHIRERNPQARIIVNTMHEEIWFIKDLLRSNVSGILFKSVHSDKVTECARNSPEMEANGMCVWPGKTSSQWISSEINVLKRISEGKNTQEIARELCVSTNTVDTHRRHLMEKLGARNVADLLMRAVSYGIIPLRRSKGNELDTSFL